MILVMSTALALASVSVPGPGLLPLPAIAKPSVIAMSSASVVPQGKPAVGEMDDPLWPMCRVEALPPSQASEPLQRVPEQGACACILERPRCATE